MAVSQQKLLIIAASLAAARFILFPLLDWQAEKKAELQTASQQLERVIRLKNAGPAQQQLLQDMQQLKQATLSQYPDASQSTQFRLNMQQQLQQQLTANGLEITLFDWLSQETQQQGQLEQHYLSITLTGQPYQLMQSVNQVVTSQPWLSIREIQIRQRLDTRSAGAATATLTLAITALRVAVGGNDV